MSDILSSNPSQDNPDFEEYTYFCCVCQETKPASLIYYPFLPRKAVRRIICRACASVGKHCPTCGEYKLFAEFPKSTNATNRGGTSAYCKKCKQARYFREYNPELQRNRNLYHNHNMTLEEYNLMLFQQAGVCAICGQPETAKDRQGRIKPLAVDHNHATNGNRELLCQTCNMFLGRIESDPIRFKKILKYLKKHNK